MTRLIPTRDRAQATRYTHADDAELVAERVRQLGSAAHIETAKRKWVVELFYPNTEPLWSGPWYVREVAE